MPGRLATQVASRPSSRSRSLAAPLPVGEPRQASHPHHPLSPCHLPPQPHHDYPLWREAQPSIAPSARNRCFLPAGFRCNPASLIPLASLALSPRAWYNERMIKGDRIRPDTLTRESAAAPCRQSKTRCGRHPAFLKNRPETCVPAVRSALFLSAKRRRTADLACKTRISVLQLPKMSRLRGTAPVYGCPLAVLQLPKMSRLRGEVSKDLAQNLFYNYRKCHASVAPHAGRHGEGRFTTTENVTPPWPRSF